MIIGTFRKERDFHFFGFIPSLSADPITINPVLQDEPASGKGIDWQVIISGVYELERDPSVSKIELGAAWNRKTTAGKAYLSVKLDSPILQAPINCALFHDDDDRYHLVWNRDDRKPAKQPG